MHNGYSMNLAWPIEQKKSKEEYQVWLKLCEKYNIKCIRVFLVPWGINPIDNSSDIALLCDVIQLAQEYSVEVILVLDTYVNYVEYSYRDFLDSEFGWKTNRFSSIYTLDSFLAMSGKTQYLVDISGVLQRIIKYSNVNKIELCNEIDQIESKRKYVIQWINNSISVLSNEFGPRFDYRVSISDYRKYSCFAKWLKCNCDIHSYRFPYNTALENYQYLTNMFPMAWISEFACFSDFAYADSIESHIYFNAMLLCASFENCKDYPAPWWWEKIVPDPTYMSIYKWLDGIKDEFSRRKIEDISIRQSEQIHEEDMKIKNKVRYRLSVLMKNPRYIKQEIPAITKFLRKRLWKKYNHSYAFVGYESRCGKKYIVLETYIPVEVIWIGDESVHTIIKCMDMTRQKDTISFMTNETILLVEGTYLLIAQNG